MAQTVQFETIQTATERITRPLNGAVACPNCGSSNVEVTPAITYVKFHNYRTHQAPFMKCTDCGKFSPLTEQQNIELAKYVMDNSETFCHHEVCEAVNILTTVGIFKRGN